MASATQQSSPPTGSTFSLELDDRLYTFPPERGALFTSGNGAVNNLDTFYSGLVSRL